MKKKICFAGFDDREIAALQPSLATLGGSWDCIFSPDAAAALDTLANAPFDALVANLSPDGIRDSELLHEAAIRHSRTLRLVLGNVADRELIVSCMGAAHQFISRPWKPPELISILERSLALDAWLSSDQLRSFIPRLGKLPGLPATYFEVLKKAESPDSSVETVAAVIARDPALTARLLQVVNSPACGLNEKITSPTEAVSRLGLEMVKSLVLCLQLFAQSAPAEGASFSLEQLWQHSFRVAKLAAIIVARCGGNERTVSDAYTAGLLHNIGQIVLATNLSREYSTIVAEARQRKCPLQEIELEHLGVTSNQVGAYLLGLWGMPLPLVEAAALYHTPALAKSVELSILTAAHVANVLAAEESGAVNGLPLPKLDADYMATLELPKKTDAWRKLLASSEPTAAPAEHPAPNRPNPATHSPPDKAFPVRQLALALVILAVVLSAVMLRRHPVRAATVAMPIAPTTTTAATASNTDDAPPVDTTAKSVETPEGKTAFQKIKLQGIIFRAGHSVAMINGKTVEPGDQVADVKVVTIGRSSVVLEYEGQRKMFTVK